MNNLTVDYGQIICTPVAAGIIATATESNFWLIFLALFISKIRFYKLVS